MNLLFQVESFLSESKRQCIAAVHRPNDHTEIAEYRQYTSNGLAVLACKHRPSTGKRLNCLYPVKTQALGAVFLLTQKQFNDLFYLTMTNVMNEC